MARNGWLARSGRTERRKFLQPKERRRARRKLVWCAMAALVAVTAAGMLAGGRLGSAQASFHLSEGGALATNVVDTADLERDGFGRPRFEGWGARPPRLIPAALRNEIHLLHQRSQRARDRRREHLRPKAFPVLPNAGDAPQRMDSGHPDPDRLLPSSRPEAEVGR